MNQRIYRTIRTKQENNMTIPLEIVTVLEIVTLDRMKTELRIPASITDHDQIITQQISSAVSYVSERTGRNLENDDTLIDEIPDALRQAVIMLVRSLYSGEGTLSGNSMVDSLIEPFVLTSLPT